MLLVRKLYVWAVDGCVGDVESKSGGYSDTLESLLFLVFVVGEGIVCVGGR